MPPPPTTPPHAPTPPDISWRSALTLPLGLLGAILGALVGCFIYYLLVSKAGLIAPFVVGVFTGIGTRYLARTGNAILAAIAFFVSIPAAVIAHWSTYLHPDPLAEYLMHPQQAFNATGWILALVGACAAAFITYAAPPRP